MSVKQTIGAILIILTATAIYLQFNGLQMRIDNDKATFYTQEGGAWLVSGREYSFIFDGSTKMRKTEASWREDLINNQTGEITIEVHSQYKEGIKKTETWTFQGDNKEVEQFPVQHTIQIIGAKGKFLRYEVRDLVYEEDTQSLDVNSMRFGRNMKIEWEKPYRWAQVYKSGILKVQYDIVSNDQTFYVRLFDPPTPFNITMQMHHNLNASLGIDNLFAPNFSLASSLNFSDNVTMEGNFTRMLTQYNITIIGNSAYTYNYTNALNTTINISAGIIKGGSSSRYDVRCQQVNLSSIVAYLLTVNATNTAYINCTLDLKNISQTYVNWTLTENNANWTFTMNFSAENTT